MRRHQLLGGLGAAALLLGALAADAGAQDPAAPTRQTQQAQQEQSYDQYLVTGPRTPRQRTAVARTGASIDEVQHAAVVVTATPREVAAIAALGYEVEPYAPITTQVLPPGFGDYHDFAEMTAAIDQIVADHPAIARQTVIGQSYQGRNIVAVKISDAVATDESEPEVLFTHSQHAREILTVEMALYILDLLTDGYGSDPRITQLVDNREIWLIPNVNPDGSEYDKTSTGFRFWRKNRQPNSGSSAVGTDLNRNWDYLWGCCGGSSGNPSSSTYRGSTPESAPEVEVVADFVRSRVVGGQQQIRAHIDWHTYGELILWPYGYTFANTAPGLDATDRSAFATLGQHMAASNGYTPQQASDLYITDGTINDWMWGVHRIFSYTYEMFPTSSSPGFYPDDALIGGETSRNREAVLRFLEYADCVYRIINVSCGGGNPPTTVFADDFETASGWAVDPDGTDTASTGHWQRGDPQSTSYSGVPLQLGTTTSGVNDLVTGAAAGSNAGVNDVDGGVTSIRSPAITLPTTGTLALSAGWYFAHLSNATSADFFRLRVVSGSTTTTVFQQTGSGVNRSAAWDTATADLTPFAGQTIRILIEAADAGTGSLIEAGVDDVRITQQT